MNKLKIIILCTLAITIQNNLVHAREHPYFVRSVSISTNGKYLLAGRLDNKIILWDRENKKIVKVIEGKQGELNIDANFTPDSKHIVFQDGTYNLMFYDIEEDKIVKRIPLDYESNHIVFLDNKKRMVLGGVDGRIEAWDLEGNKKIATLKVPDIHGPFPAINGMVLSPGGDYFVTSVFGRGGGWDLGSEPEQDFEQVETKSGNKNWIIKYGGTNLWDAKTLTKIKKLQGERIRGRTWSAFSPDGKYILVTSEDGWIYKFDSETGGLLMEYERVLGDGIGFVESSNKYFVILVALEGGSGLVLWDKDNVKKLDKYLKLKHDAVTGVLAALPSQNLIVTGDRDGSISVYHFNPEKLDIELEWHPKPVPAGIIKWISPLYLIDKTPEQISELKRRYEEEQKKLIEKEK